MNIRLNLPIFTDRETLKVTRRLNENQSLKFGYKQLHSCEGTAESSEILRSPRLNDIYTPIGCMEAFFCPTTANISMGKLLNSLNESFGVVRLY